MGICAQDIAGDGEQAWFGFYRVRLFTLRIAGPWQKYFSGRIGPGLCIAPSDAILEAFGICRLTVLICNGS